MLRRWIAILACLLSPATAFAQDRPVVLVVVQWEDSASREVMCAMTASKLSDVAEVISVTYTSPQGAGSQVRAVRDQNYPRLVAVVGPAGSRDGTADQSINDALRESRLAHISLALHPVLVDRRRQGTYFRTGTTYTSLRQAAERHLIVNKGVRSLSVAGLGAPVFNSDNAWAHFQAISGTSGVRGAWFDSTNLEASAIVGKFGRGDVREGVVLPPWNERIAEDVARSSSNVSVAVLAPRAPLPVTSRENLFFVTPASAESLAAAEPSLRTGLEEFSQRYRRSSDCGNAKPEGYALSAYIAFQTIEQVISSAQLKAGNLSDAERRFSEALSRGRFDTVAGRGLQYGPSGELRYDYAVAAWVKDTRGGSRPDALGTGGGKQTCSDKDQCSRCNSCKDGSGNCVSQNTCN